MSSRAHVVVLHPRVGTAVVECKGEHDLTTRDELAALLGALVAEHELVVVDVTESAFVDSGFLHALVTAHRDACARGSKLRLQCGREPIVRRALELSGVLAAIGYAESREAALDGTGDGG